MANTKKNVHVFVNPIFFDMFIEKPRKSAERKLGIKITQPKITEMIAMQQIKRIASRNSNLNLNFDIRRIKRKKGFVI